MCVLVTLNSDCKSILFSRFSADVKDVFIQTRSSMNSWPEEAQLLLLCVSSPDDGSQDDGRDAEAQN